MAMILSAFVPSFMRILTKMAQEEVGQLLGVPGEVDKLTLMVHRIEGVLVDAERKQNVSEAINRWVMQLKNAMYDADEIIDLCCIKTDERRARSGSSSTKTSCGINFHFLSCFRNPLFAHEIAGKIKAINSKMNAVVNQIGILGLIENRGNSNEARQMAFNENRKTHPVGVPSDIVGEKIKEDAEQLVRLLLPENAKGEENIPIIAIVGMGGIGKTTLARNVYNHPTIQQHFEERIWVCVSKDNNPVDLMKNVVRQLEGRDPDLEEISELIPRIQSRIAGYCRFLLVLDDIWAESERVWDDLLRLAMSSGDPRSRVLITTRDGKVAMRMRATHTHKVSRLTDEDGWNLLVKQVAPTRVESEIEHLKDIGMQIVKKCDGLPLVIKSIGIVLCTEGNTRGKWQEVLESDVWSMDGQLRDVHHSFYLSYEDLLPPLKQCFIFCSLFPKGFGFQKTDLISLWHAEGFLQDNKGDIWKLGNEYYTQLLLRNLLDVTEASYNQVECKMHDLWWSFARQLGKDENCELLEGQVSSNFGGLVKVRRLSIEGNEVNSEVIKKKNGLRTLLLRGKPEVALDDLCKVGSNLRILDLCKSNVSSLPDSLGDLVHLRYLDVRKSNIKNLPNSIGNLKYLVYLNLEECKDLSHVPHSIINLLQLIFLNTYNSGVEAIPTGMHKLDKLVELHGFKPYQNNLEGFSSLGELGALSELVTLQLECLEKVLDIEIAKKANLQSKNRLHNLYLKYTSLSKKDHVSLTDEKKITTEYILNELSPPISLEVVTIEGYFGSCLPNWLNWGAALPNLRCVEISDCGCFERLAPLGQLPNLNLLRIRGAYSDVSVGEEFSWRGNQIISDIIATNDSAFPKLNEISFEEMPNWKEWKWSKEHPAMPELKKLSIRACPKLISLPEGLSHHATSLEYLEIDGGNELINMENYPSIQRIGTYENPNLVRISNQVRQG